MPKIPKRVDDRPEPISLVFQNLPVGAGSPFGPNQSIASYRVPSGKWAEVAFSWQQVVPVPGTLARFNVELTINDRPVQILNSNDETVIPEAATLWRLPRRGDRIDIRLATGAGTNTVDIILSILEHDA